jgi:DNA modification methylase
MMLPNREIRVGDCRALLRELPDESVNCVVTSPPYWGLRDYGVDGQIGLEETPEEYVAKMVEVFREVRRVLRSDGVAWLNLGDSYATGAGSAGDSPGGGPQGAWWAGDPNRIRDDKRGYRGDRLANGRGDSPAILRKKTRALRDGSHCGKHTAMAANGPMSQPNRMPIAGLKPKDMVGIPWRVAFALQADGWWLRADVIWAKANPMPESVQDRPTKAHEYLFLLTKSEHYAYDAAAIRERQTAPEASTPDDLARAFNRRRSATIDPRQEAIGSSRKRSGNKTRQYRADYGGPQRRATNQGFGIPWEDTDGLRNKRSVWTIATEPYGGGHFATFPKKLVEPCILAGCPAGGLVLDPFGGSGTVGEVAEALGRRWMLLELNPAYAELARARTAQRGLFGDVAAAALTGGAA